MISNLPLKFELSDQDKRYIHASVNRAVWNNNMAQYDEEFLRSYEFLR